MYPDMAKFIKADGKWKAELGEGRREIHGGTTSDKGIKEYGDWGVDHATFTGNIDAIGKILGGKNDVLILEFWVKDYSTKKVILQEAGIEIDEFGFETLIEEISEEVPKYPGNISQTLLSIHYYHLSWEVRPTCGHGSRSLWQYPIRTSSLRGASRLLSSLNL
jgi:hypothetical protein